MKSENRIKIVQNGPDITARPALFFKFYSFCLSVQSFNAVKSS